MDNLITLEDKRFNLLDHQWKQAAKSKPFSLASALQAAISDLHTQSVFTSFMQIPMQKRGCTANITPHRFPPLSLLESSERAW